MSAGLIALFHLIAHWRFVVWRIRALPKRELPRGAEPDARATRRAVRRLEARGVRGASYPLPRRGQAP